MPYPKENLKMSFFQVRVFDVKLYLPIYIFFIKNENKENIKNNIRAMPLNRNITCSQTMEVQKERLSRFPLIVNFISVFYFIY